jgi:hypothetical protein
MFIVRLRLIPEGLSDFGSHHSLYFSNSEYLSYVAVVVVVDYRLRMLSGLSPYLVGLRLHVLELEGNAAF